MNTEQGHPKINEISTQIEEGKKDTVISYLRNILISMPGNLYWKDKAGTYLGCTYTMVQTAGLQTIDQLVGKTDYDIFPKEQADVIRSNDEEVMRTNTSKTTEEVTTFPDHQKRTFAVIKVPLKNDKGEVVGIIGNSLDITELKETQVNLEKAKTAAEAANRAKTEFLENMRHDIRTPLVGIIGFSEIIKEEAPSAKIKKYAEDLVSSSKALLEFLNKILESIKIASGELPLLKKKFNLHKQLQTIVDLNRAGAAEKKLKLEFIYDEAIPHYVIGNPLHIQRIMLELIANALKFTNQGQVKVSAHLVKRENREIVIKFTVSDTGIGIPADKQQDIFIRFRRLTPAYQGIYAGAGLGLNIVKQFIDELQGEIYLESQLNQGSTFTCLVPFQEPLIADHFGVQETSIPLEEIHSKISPPTPSPASEFTPSSTKSNTRVLLIEDQPISAQVAQHILSELGCQVDIAENGATALQHTQAHYYDLILMDVGLPDKDGYEVTQLIRVQHWQQESTTHTPIIGLTAHVDSESKQRCLEAGMDAVLSKPLKKETALDILNAFIPKRATEQKQCHPQQEKQEEKMLFELPESLIDFDEAVKISGHLDEVKKLIAMLKQSLSQELTHLQSAYQQKNWKSIQNIAHKLKGGSCYCGAHRLKAACTHLEGYLKSDQTKWRDKLYEQLLQEISNIRNMPE